MIALSIVKIYSKTLSIGSCWRCSQFPQKGIYLPPKHVLWCIGRQAAFYGLFCRRAQETKKNKKAREVATFNFIPTPTLYP